MREGWEYKKLGDLCDIYQPKTLATEQLVADGKYYVYGANGIIGRYNDYNHEQSEILLTCRGATCGTINISQPYSWINGNAMVIHRKSEDLSFDFLKYLMLSLDYSLIITGAAQPQITRQKIAPTIVKFPSLSVQQSIVSELDKINELICLKKEQLCDYDKLAQSLFYEMFGDPVENEKGWEVKKLGEIGELARGVSKHRPRNAPELLGGTMPLIQTGDVANANFYIRDYTQTYSELGVAQSKVWRKGTLCITIAATIGKCAILDFTACFPDSVVGFKPKESIETIFMYFIFSNMQKMLEDFAPGVAQKNINLKILNDLDIPIPPLSLQQLFASRITQIEALKSEIQRTIRDLETLLASRMQYWFFGF